MTHTIRRLTLNALLIALALITVGTVFAAAIDLMNEDLRDDAPPYGVPEYWTLLGDATVVKDGSGDPGDTAVLFPDTEKTSAFYQVATPPDFLLPSHSCVLTRAGTKQLTALTAFFGTILTYDDGSHARVYRAMPAGSYPVYHWDVNVYLNSSVASAKVGAVYFGKRGGGSVAFDTFAASAGPCF